MSDWGGGQGIPWTHVSTYGPYAPWELPNIASPANAAVTWVANLGIYVPISLPVQYPVRRLFWGNGSTVTGNVDVGVYSTDGTLLVHCGSTAQAGASAVQYANPSGGEVLLPPGPYYLALVTSGTTTAINGTISWTATQLRDAGVTQQAIGSSTLPNSFTAAVMANALYPTCGITRYASGF